MNLIMKLAIEIFVGNGLIKFGKVAEGGEHSAQVGCNVLQDEYICHISLIAGAVQDQIAQRQEGEQCHVIGDEHGTDEGDIHQGNGGKTEVLCKAYDLFRTDIEETDLPESTDHGKGTEKAGKGTEVKVADVRCIRRYDDGGCKGKDGGDGKDDIPADESGDCVKYDRMPAEAPSCRVLHGCSGVDALCLVHNTSLCAEIFAFARGLDQR